MRGKMHSYMKQFYIFLKTTIINSVIVYKLVLETFYPDQTESETEDQRRKISGYGVKKR